jgi:two-component system response regulator PhoP
MKTLVIEDDGLLRQQISEALTASGYTVESSTNGEDGLFQALEYAVDIAIIDLGLPKINGLDVIKQIRAEGKEYPVLILTARNSWQEKVRGLELGADDYLTKPFQMEELQARIAALLRRANGKTVPVIKAGTLFIDTAAKSVTVANNPIQLTAKEYAVLEYLSHHPNTTLSKSTLLEHIYQDDIILDRSLNLIEQYVKSLRKKLQPSGNHSLIKTVRGHGYMLELSQ